jgi:hypothetical protein
LKPDEVAHVRQERLTFQNILTEGAKRLGNADGQGWSIDRPMMLHPGQRLDGAELISLGLHIDAAHSPAPQPSIGHWRTTNGSHIN